MVPLCLSDMWSPSEASEGAKDTTESLAMDQLVVQPSAGLEQEAAPLELLTGSILNSQDPLC